MNSTNSILFTVSNRFKKHYKNKSAGGGAHGITKKNSTGARPRNVTVGSFMPTREPATDLNATKVTVTIMLQAPSPLQYGT